MPGLGVRVMLYYKILMYTIYAIYIVPKICTTIACTPMDCKLQCNYRVQHSVTLSVLHTLDCVGVCHTQEWKKSSCLKCKWIYNTQVRMDGTSGLLDFWTSGLLGFNSSRGLASESALP